MSLKVLIPIADGSEEMEAVIIIDLLRRAQIEAVVAGENAETVCSRGVKIVADALLDDIDSYEKFDAVVLPGGLGGTERLSKNAKLATILKNSRENNTLVGAVCAAPLALKAAGVIPKGVAITSHPSVKDKLGEYKYSEDAVAFDRGIITSRGAGTAIDFALSIIEKLIDKKTADEIAAGIVYQK